MNPVARVRPRQARVCLSIVFALLFVVASLVPGLTPSVEAQQPPVAEIQLVGQRIHSTPDGTLGASVRVTNRSETPLSGLILQVGYLERVDNRTALHEIFDGSLEPGSSGRLQPPGPGAGAGGVRNHRPRPRPRHVPALDDRRCLPLLGNSLRDS